MRLILIIEDDINLLEGLEIFLEMEGYDTISTINGFDGIELARRHHPDLVLTNFQLPGVDGLEVLRAIQTDEKTRRTPIIFTTANNSPSIRERALAEGADACLMKPFTTDSLMRVIGELLYSQMDSDEWPDRERNRI